MTPTQSFRSGAVDILKSLQQKRHAPSGRTGTDKSWAEHGNYVGRTALYHKLSSADLDQILNRVVNFKGELTIAEVERIYQDVTKSKKPLGKAVTKRLIDDLQIGGLVSDSYSRVRLRAINSLRGQHLASLN